MNVPILSQFTIEVIFKSLDTEYNLFCALGNPNAAIAAKWVGIVSTLASPVNGFSIT
ncbi:MAG TPA: hypothetical protein VJY41_06115 [Prolixibacteraceae bacterium]|nr:hypothetical protein [Prolixibacteraceae bacterium]